MEKFTEEFPLERFVTDINLDELLYKFENERKVSDLDKYGKKSYTLEEFEKEFPKRTITDVSGNKPSER